MEFDEVIKARKSIRNFNVKDRIIDDETIKQIVEAGRCAPSARNRQPWMYYVTKGKEKAKIANILREEVKLGQMEDTGLTSARLIDECQVFILAFVRTGDYYFHTDMLSMGASVENIVLKAIDLGIGTLWVSDVVSAKTALKKEFDESGMVAAGICLGYTSKPSFSPPKKQLNEIMIIKKE